jgi:hypothetical protein
VVCWYKGAPLVVHKLSSTIPCCQRAASAISAVMGSLPLTVGQRSPASSLLLLGLLALLLQFALAAPILRTNGATMRHLAGSELASAEVFCRLVAKAVVCQPS